MTCFRCVIVLVGLLTLLHEVLGKQCSNLNANHEILFSSKTKSNFKNYISGFARGLNSREMVLIQTQRNLDGNVSSTLFRGNFDEVNGGSRQKNVLLDPNDHIFVGLSNFVEGQAAFKDGDELFGITAFQSGNKLWFGKLDSKLRGFSSFSQWSDRSSVEILAPFKSEPVYNVKGEVVRQNTDQIVTVNSVFPVDTKKFQLFLTEFQDNKAFLYALIRNMGSVKLVGYMVSMNDFKLQITQIWANIIIPQVDGVNLEGVLEYSPAFFTVDKNGKIVMVVNLSIQQQKAFNKEHNLNLEFANDQQPFTLTISSEGKILQANPSFYHRVTDSKDAFYATGIDIRGKMAVVSVNTKSQELYTDLIQQTTVDQEKTFGNIAYASFANLTDEGYVTWFSQAATTPKDTELYSNDIVFAPDSSDEGESVSFIVIFGGSFRTSKSKNKFEGRLQLLDAASGKTIRNLFVGEEFSTVATKVKRFVDKKGNEDIILSMLTKGPTSAYTENNAKKRYLSSGVWSVDCSPLNRKVELGATILFYIIFGLTVFFLVSGVISFTACCIRDIVKSKKQKKQNEEETQSLIQN